MVRPADLPLWGAAAFCCVLAATPSAQQVAAATGTAAERPLSDSVLRTFTIEKPAAVLAGPPAGRASSSEQRLPRVHDVLRTTLGLGYVQGADWGAELTAGGAIAGTQVQANTLVTRGREGFVLDQGSISVFDPEVRWRAEAGDLFSHLRGASRGLRISLPTGNDLRRPAFALYGPGRGAHDQSSVVSYRDQLQIGEQTLLDAEIASDRSFVLRNRLGADRWHIEGFYRSSRRPTARRDASVSLGLTLWRGIDVNAGVYRELASADRYEWRSLAVRLPIGRHLDVTLERASAGTRDRSQTTSAVMGGLTAGQLRLFHRQQIGEYEFGGSGSTGTIERQQSQSLASYSAGPRFSIVLQLATQRLDTGRIQHWEEMQTTVRLTDTTTLRTVTAIPDVRDAERWRAHFRQELPSRFSLQADYGRLSAFQSIPAALDRSRLKLMLARTWDVQTPMRGAQVGGRVLDDAGRPVPGASVTLGAYSTMTDASGAYGFKHVPAGQLELGLDRNALPADVAWDGRTERLTLTTRSRVVADLRVVPLNSIHGRVYCDRNANGRYDRGEGVAGVVVRIGDSATTTDQDGKYSVGNLWPADYRITVDAAKIPSEFSAGVVTELKVTLNDDGPVTGADFCIVPKTKPIIWSSPAR